MTAKRVEDYESKIKAKPDGTGIVTDSPEAGPSRSKPQTVPGVTSRLLTVC